MLNVLLWAPLAAGVVLLVAPRAASRWIGVVGALVALGLRDRIGGGLRP